MQVKLHELSKSFGGKTVVDIHDFTINNGDIMGLVGNNGAGKTTLFRLMLDLLKADSGTVTMVTADGQCTIDPTVSEDWKQMSGAYIDEGFLIDFLTPEEYFDFTAKINNLPPIDWKNLDDSILSPFIPFTNGEIFNQKKLIRDFSAGNKQKIGIVSALFTKPELVVLDEPFNFLDPTGQNTLKQIIKQYAQSTGATVLISSHNLQHTTDISTRIALLEHGHIIEDLPNINGSANQALEEYFKV